MSIDNTTWPPTGYETVCEAYNFTLGTIDCFEHLLLPNVNYWNTSLSNLLIRLFEETNVTSKQLYTYIEGIPAGPLNFPRSIKFMIGSFPDLFGTKNGQMLRKWCEKENWILVWSLGLNLGESYNFWTAASIESTFESNNRILDPHILSNTNVSSSLIHKGDIVFDRIWNRLNQTRTDTNGSVSNVTLASFWNDLVTGLPTDLSIDAVRPSDCSDFDRCIGVSKHSRHCVCYDKK